MMRIITGRARGVRLVTLEGENTRPTSERAKEAIFSSLGDFVVGCRVLDLFAGSGQMGLEALSRGASSLLLCERARDAADVIRKNIEKTKLTEAELRTADFSGCLSSLAGKRRFDLVFLDPPYASDCMARALRGLYEGRLLSEGAIVVCESRDEKALFAGDEALASLYTVKKTARYGIAWVTYLSPDAERWEEAQV